MRHFKTQRDAKEFLVGEIVREAERQGHPLADIERKMLYFSESGRTLPDMDDIADSFDREYDRVAYERKIAKLVRAARRGVTTDKAAWSEAIERLKEGDHYLLVMFGEAGGGKGMMWRGAVAVVSLLVVGGVGNFVLTEFFTRDEREFIIWASFAGVFVIGSAIRFFAGAEAFDGWMSRVIDRALGTRRR